METIEKIEKMQNGKDGAEKWSSYEGYEVLTTKQKIRLGISEGQSCCESTGFFWMNDKPEEFIGAQVNSVTITDQALNTEKAPEVYDGGVMYVNIETDRGTLQFTAYNAHNGYYGHSAIVRCEQLNHDTTL